MKQTRKGKITYLQPNGLPATMTAGFTTRNGGVSRPPYNSLNLGLGTDDNPANVEGNRSTLARTFDLAPHQLLTVKQVHGNDILLIDDNNPDLSHFLSIECDAVISNQKDMIFGVLTADCYPILLWSEEQHVAAAIHAGWRGAANGLITKVIGAIKKNFAIEPNTLKAAIGPGIGAHNYEVDRPVREAFRKGSGFWDEISKETSLGHWQVDLRLSCQLQLEQAGIVLNNIDIAQQCTCCHSELFFSHRRDDGTTGRQLAFIRL